jgi:hypothetical protein
MLAINQKLLIIVSRSEKELEYTHTTRKDRTPLSFLWRVR